MRKQTRQSRREECEESYSWKPPKGLLEDLVKNGTRLHTMTRKRFSDQWYEGSVEKEDGPVKTVKYSDDGTEDLLEEEVLVNSAAYLLHHHYGDKVSRPPLYTLVRKKFDEGWFNGMVIDIDRRNNQSHIFYADDVDHGYVSDEELKVMATAYFLHDKLKQER